MFKKVCVLIFSTILLVSPVLETQHIAPVQTAEAAVPAAGAIVQAVIPDDDVATWYPINNLSFVTTMKLKRATRAVLAASIIAFLPGKSISFQAFGGIVAGALSTQFFVLSDTEDVITYVDYYYINIPGIYDNMGNYYPMYRVKRVSTAYTAGGKYIGTSVEKSDTTNILASGL